MIWLRNSIFIFCGLFLLTACPSSRSASSYTKLKKHHFDFSDLQTVSYNGISARIPKILVKETSKFYLLEKDGLSFFNPEISVFLSIESFESYKIEKIMKSFKEGTKDLDAVNGNYVDFRVNSLYKPKLSLYQDSPKKAKLKGYYQFVEEQEGVYGKMMYMFTTVKKRFNNQTNYYVVQLIAPSELSKYLVDDFQKLLLSLE